MEDRIAVFEGLTTAGVPNKHHCADKWQSLVPQSRMRLKESGTPGAQALMEKQRSNTGGIAGICSQLCLDSWEEKT